MNTKVLERIESTGKHPSFPDGMPAIIAEPVEHGYCTDCASLAGQIRACERLGDRDGMVAYGWQAIRHVSAAHASPGPRLRRELPGLTSSPHRDEAGIYGQRSAHGGAR